MFCHFTWNKNRKSINVINLCEHLISAWKSMRGNIVWYWPLSPKKCRRHSTSNCRTLFFPVVSNNWKHESVSIHINLDNREKLQSMQFSPNTCRNAENFTGQRSWFQIFFPKSRWHFYNIGEQWFLAWYSPLPSPSQFNNFTKDNHTIVITIVIMMCSKALLIKK